MIALITAVALVVLPVLIFANLSKVKAILPTRVSLPTVGGSESKVKSRKGGMILGLGVIAIVGYVAMALLTPTSQQLFYAFALFVLGMMIPESISKSLGRMLMGISVMIVVITTLFLSGFGSWVAGKIEQIEACATTNGASCLSAKTPPKYVAEPPKYVTVPNCADGWSVVFSANDWEQYKAVGWTRWPGLKVKIEVNGTWIDFVPGKPKDATGAKLCTTIAGDYYKDNRLTWYRNRQ